MVLRYPAFALWLFLLVPTAWPAMAAPPDAGPAQSPRPASVGSRDPATVPVLAGLLKDGYPPRYLRFDDRIGLDVWFVRMPDNTPRVIYTLPNGQALFGGQVYVPGSAAGQMTYLTGQHGLEAAAVLAGEHVVPIPPTLSEASPNAQGAAAASAGPATPPALHPPSPGTPSATALVGAFDAASWIEAGPSSAPLIYVVVDPQCPYCRDFWKAIRPDVRDGRVRVRLIVATPLGANSLPPAAAILAAPNPLAAWDAHTDGRPLPAPKADADITTARKHLAENDQMRLSVLSPAGLTGVPFLLYRNAQGKLGYLRGIAAADVPALVAGVSPLHQAPKP